MEILYIPKKINIKIRIFNNFNKKILNSVQLIPNYKINLKYQNNTIIMIVINQLVLQMMKNNFLNF